MEVKYESKGYVGAEHTTLGQEPKPECPDTYLVWAILTTCLCCLPFGVVAIVKASQVEKFYYMGLYQEAYKASNSAKKWSIVGAVVAIGGGLLYVLVLLVLSKFAGVSISELLAV